MYPFSLFAKAANGEPMTPWQRSQYKLWQVLGTTVTAFLLVNLPTIQQIVTDPGSTDIWYAVRTQLLVPLVVALILAFIKYQGARTDVTPPAGQSLKIQTSGGAGTPTVRRQREYKGLPPFGSTQIEPPDPPVADGTPSPVEPTA